MLDILQKNYSNVTSEKTKKSDLGLSQQKAEELLKANGHNKLAESKKKNVMLIFANQFKDIMVLILLISTVVSVFLGEMYDALTIVLIVMLNSILGFIQEFRTEKTLESLKNMTAPTSRVYRDGELRVIPAEELVVGDFIELEAGDKIPADCVFINTKSVYAEESILTGEDIPVEKRVGDINDINNSLNKSNIGYMGTIITKGHGIAKIIATGMNSQMGKVSGMLEEIKDEETPLQTRLGELGKIVAIICVGVCIVVFAAGVIRGEEIFKMIMTGISIAIAAIPEGLPATVTIALALAVRRMLKQKALVHRLHSVETLGCASVICSDKTGTITENKMTVTKIFCNNKILDVLGSGYKISGEIQHEGLRINPLQSPSLEELLISSVLCNNATISTNSPISTRDRGAIRSQGTWNVTGDPTEIALLVASAKAKVRSEDLLKIYKKIDEIPFDSETKCMTVLVETQSGASVAYMKGALDVIINKCSHYMTDTGIVPLNYALKKKILDTNIELTDTALRVLGFAKKEIFGNFESNSGLVFLGMMGMLDPPRAEAKAAIKTCEKAHIKTVMITGDHKNTACAIARQAGILKGNQKVLTGAELNLITDDELDKEINNIAVYARVNPSDKLRIVRAFKRSGQIVTMTGDGVNDAPAVKEASIGVSMGITGTDVTKQAADVILLDDNFATLVNAVEQGRTIYANIRKFVRYMLSCNLGEVVTMFLGILMGFPLVLLPTQILLVNLVTDGLPAIALGMEPSEKDIMKRAPRKPDESFFSDGLMTKIIFRGIMIGLCTLGSFVAMLRLGGTLDTARTAALFTLVASQLIHVFECKSEKKNIFNVPYFNNLKLIGAVLLSSIIIFSAVYMRLMQNIFGTVSLTQLQLLIAFGFSIGVPIISSFSNVFNKSK